MPERYFFFSYSCRNKTKEAVGNLWLSCDVLPHNELIRGKIAERSWFDPHDCVVTGIFEFKSKEDFDSFGA